LFYLIFFSFQKILVSFFGIFGLRVVYKSGALRSALLTHILHISTNFSASKYFEYFSHSGGLGREKGLNCPLPRRCQNQYDHEKASKNAQKLITDCFAYKRASSPGGGFNPILLEKLSRGKKNPCMRPA